MNGQRAKMLKKLTKGATVAGAYPAAKRWWEWMSLEGRAHVSRLVTSGELVTLGAGWRTAFRMTTTGAPVPTRSKRKSFRAKRYGY